MQCSHATMLCVAETWTVSAPQSACLADERPSIHHHVYNMERSRNQRGNTETSKHPEYGVSDTSQSAMDRACGSDANIFSKQIFLSLLPGGTIGLQTPSQTYIHIVVKRNLSQTNTKTQTSDSCEHAKDRLHSVIMWDICRHIKTKHQLSLIHTVETNTRPDVSLLCVNNMPRH